MQIPHTYGDSYEYILFVSWSVNYASPILDVLILTFFVTVMLLMLSMNNTIRTSSVWWHIGFVRIFTIAFDRLLYARLG